MVMVKEKKVMLIMTAHHAGFHGGEVAAAASGFGFEILC